MPQKNPTRKKQPRVRAVRKPKLSMSDVMKFFVIGNNDSDKKKTNYLCNSGNNSHTNTYNNLVKCRTDLKVTKERLRNTQLELKRALDNKSSPSSESY